MATYSVLTPSTSSEEDLLHMLRPKEVLIEDRTDSEEEYSSSSMEDEIIEPKKPNIDMPTEYWHIQKLFKYLKSGNQTATMIALCCLRDLNLADELHQFAVQECGGIEILVNLLDTEDLKCKLGTLSILLELIYNDLIRQCLVDLGCVPLLVKNLREPPIDLKILVGEVMHHLCLLPKARKDVRHCNGIPLLVDLLELDDRILNTRFEDLTQDQEEATRLVRSAAMALWSLSKSKKNMHIMMKSGCVRLMAKLLGSDRVDIMIPTLGALSQCAVLPSFQMAVNTEGMIDGIVKNLYEEHACVLQYCCETIFYAAEVPETRDMVRKAGGLHRLMVILNDHEYWYRKDLLAAVTGAIWKTSLSTENAQIFESMQVVNVLVNFLDDPDEDERVLSNVVGGLSEFLKFPHNRDVVRRSGRIPNIVNLLNETYLPLLENLTMLLRECAEDEDSMGIIQDVDGVRLIWSLLKNKSLKVQANAALCLVPCIRNAQNSGGMVRSFVGGLELILRGLYSSDVQVLGCICAVIAEIAGDQENLGIISDLGVVQRLVELIPTEDVFLREHLCSAIGACCAWGSNRKIFGRLRAITPLVGYLAANNEKVNKTATIALYRLSANQFNCVTMHESGVVRFLLRSTASRDEELQEAAAGCLANMRKLVFEAETMHLVEKKDSGREADNK